jgi:hypothetical protein
LKSLVVGLAAVVVAAVLFVAAQQGMFSNTIGDGADQPPAAPAGALAWVDSDVTLTHFSGSDWTLGLNAAARSMNGTVRASAGEAEISRGGDEVPGKWYIDGAADLYDKNGIIVWSWKLDPSFVDVGYNGESVWLIKYTPRTPYLTETGTYVYRVAVHIWFERGTDQTIFGDTRLSTYTNFIILP